MIMKTTDAAVTDIVEYPVAIIDALAAIYAAHHNAAVVAGVISSNPVYTADTLAYLIKNTTLKECKELKG